MALNRNIYKFLALVLFLLYSIGINAKSDPLKIKIESEPSGARVYMDGRLVCSSTPAVISIPNKSKYFYTIEKTKVSNTSRAPFSIKFTFVKEGYENKEEIYEGGYYNASKYYYIVKPKSSGVVAFMQKDNSSIAQSNNIGNNKRESFLVRWFFEAAQDDCRIFWRVISSCPEKVKNSSELYLGTTSYDETKNLKIEGLNRDNAGDVQIEIKASKTGYKSSSKRFNALQIINQQEISWFFDLEPL